MQTTTNFHGFVNYFLILICIFVCRKKPLSHEALCSPSTNNHDYPLV